MAGQRAKQVIGPRADESGTRARILAGAEELLRRHGPAKMTVVDVARHLRMSHANVYRHFESKAALQDAVAGLWLHRISEPLGRIASGKQPASDRLTSWLRELGRLKRQKVLHEPELFATYHQLAEAARTVVAEHVKELHAQVEQILRDGVQFGEFHVSDLSLAAAIVLNTTVSFHHPHFVQQGGTALDSELFNKTIAMLVKSLQSGAL